MASQNKRCLFQLLIFLSSITVSDQYSDSNIVEGKLQVFKNMLYQYGSSDSTVDQIVVRKSIQCAAQCMQNSLCETAIFNQPNGNCLLLSEIELGQFSSNNQAVTFQHKKSLKETNSISATFPITTTEIDTAAATTKSASTVTTTATATSATKTMTTTLSVSTVTVSGATTTTATTISASTVTTTTATTTISISTVTTTTVTVSTITVSTTTVAALETTTTAAKTTTVAALETTTSTSTPPTATSTTLTTTVTTTSTSSSTSTSTSTTTKKTTTTTTITTTPNPPVATTSLSQFCGCTNFTLSLTSISFDTADATYQWQASLSSSGVWSNRGSSRLSYPLLMSSQSGTTVYRCILSLPGPPTIILTSTTVTVNNYMCAPAVLPSGCNSQVTINNFILVGEYSTEINEIGTGCAANNYRNKTSSSVTLFAGMAYIAFVSTGFSSNVYLGIWIDFDNDLVFESSERVALTTMSGTSDNDISLVIPPLSSSVLTGTHRMRVTLLYNIYPPNPCGPPASYGETHDYTVNIIPYASGSLTYSRNFLYNVVPNSQCTAWTKFNSLSPLRAYTSLNIHGSRDSTGVTLSNPAAVYRIVYALRTFSSYGPFASNGLSWAVASCGDGYQLRANGEVCKCIDDGGYTISPCMGNENWGGVDSTSCGASSQTITVEYEY